MSSLKAEHGLEAVSKMRRKTGNGNPGGGIAIIYKTQKISLSEYPIKRGPYELICAKGKLKNNTRHFFVLGAYLPPKLKAAESRKCLEYISGAILRIKTDFKNPYIAIGGDFNGRDLQEAIGDYYDIQEVTSGATRAGAWLDLCAVNFNNELDCVTNHPPLTTEDGTPSDHRLVSYSYKLKHTHQFEWLRYSKRKVTDQGTTDYEKMMTAVPWTEFVGSAEEMAHRLHKTIQDITDACFPLKHHKVRSTDDPWIDEETRDMITKRKEVFGNRGRESTEWKHMKAITNGMIRRRKKRFYDQECEKLAAQGSHNIAYKALRNITNTERSQQWDVRQLRPDTPENILAEELADYFASISNEFPP